MIGGFYVVGIIVYALMAASTPLATAEQFRELQEENESSNSLDLIQSSSLDQLEAKLSKIESMKNQNLITSEEAEKLRAKALGI